MGQKEFSHVCGALIVSFMLNGATTIKYCGINKLDMAVNN